MKYSPWAIVALVAGVVIVGSQVWSGRGAEGGAGPIPFRNDLDKALKEAEAAGKPVFAYFTADWCPPCKKMKAETFRDEKVVKAMEAYVPVMIDVDKDAETAGRYNVKSIPTYFVLDAKGNPQKGETGFKPADAMVKWLAR